MAEAARVGEGEREKVHEWELVDAIQVRDGDDVLDLSWRCSRCGKPWGTVSGVTMPNEEAGECDPS